MIDEIERCNICEKITAIIDKNGRTALDEIDGICWGNMGYSRGGWGSRSDFMNDYSMEVCRDCFKVLEKKILEFKDAFIRLQGTCRDEISISKVYQNGRTGHTVHDVQDDKLQLK